MEERLLVDTDVLIDYLRGVGEAVDWVETCSSTMLVSAISVAELFAGVREGEERRALDDFLRAFEVIHVDQRIAQRGGLYRRDYLRSHGTGLADALLAATADLLGARLATLNRTHFPMLTDVLVPYSKP